MVGSAGYLFIIELLGPFEKLVVVNILQDDCILFLCECFLSELFSSSLVFGLFRRDRICHHLLRLIHSLASVKCTKFNCYMRRR